MHCANTNHEHATQHLSTNEAIERFEHFLEPMEPIKPIERVFDLNISFEAKPIEQAERSNALNIWDAPFDGQSRNLEFWEIGLVETAVSGEKTLSLGCRMGADEEVGNDSFPFTT